MGKRSASMAAMLAIGFGLPTQAMAADILDGTSGSNVSSSAKSTTGGGLTLGLGFFVDYLVVGGGGGGGSNVGGGGGGGGIQSGSSNVSATSYAVNVGVGGSGGSSGGNGTNGGNTTLFSVTANGGSAGQGSAGTRNGGASGAPQAKSGGTGWVLGFGDGAAGGGGGGAGANGSNGNTNSVGGAGGSGLANSITGASVTYSGGGGGGNEYTSSGPGPGGAGGAGGGGAGGQGQNNSLNIGGNGTVAGAGGGGGGGFNGPGGNGAAGMAIVRYPTSSPALGFGVTGGTITAGSGTATGYTLHTFSSAGSSALNFSGLNLNNLGAVQTGVISGTGDLTYQGPGTLTLNAANDYTGGTNVTGGKLAIGASGSIASSTGVNVGSGATFDVSGASGFTIGGAQTLSGTGSILGALAIAGTHSPGNSAGIQVFDNNLTYNAGASVNWELFANSSATAGTDYDQISLTGTANLDFAGATSLYLTFDATGSVVNWADAFWDSDQSWKVWDVASGSTSNFGNLSIFATAWQDSTSVLFSTARPLGSFGLSQVGQSVFLNYTPVPEPSTYALGAIGAAVMAFAARRRKARKA